MKQVLTGNMMTQYTVKAGNWFACFTGDKGILNYLSFNPKTVLNQQKEPKSLPPEFDTRGVIPISNFNSTEHFIEEPNNGETLF
jgi:hypothetical protein